MRRESVKSRIDAYFFYGRGAATQGNAQMSTNFYNH
jgi:hypothetical protein